MQKALADMRYQMNPELNYINDPFEGVGYIVKSTGTYSVVNKDAMRLLSEKRDVPIQNPSCKAFLKNAKKFGWIKCANKPTENYTKIVTTPFHLKKIQIELLIKCNLQCVHCYCASPRGNSHEMDTKTIYDLIDQASEMGVMYFAITGGEPLIHKDIFSIIGYARDKRLSIALFTNCTLINARTVERFKKLKIAMVRTSLDALTPEVHDEFRGVKGAYKKTIKGIRLLRKGNIPVTVSVMVHKKNIHEIKQLVEFLKGELDVSCRLDRVAPIGRALENRDIYVSNDEFRDVLKALYTNCQVTNDCNGPTFKKDAIHPSCGIGHDYLFIKSNGEVVICPTMTESESQIFKAGNLRDTPLQEIWMHNPTFRLFRGVQCKSIDSCENAHMCRGGCRSNAYLSHGTVDAPDELYCSLYKSVSS